MARWLVNEVRCSPRANLSATRHDTAPVEAALRHHCGSCSSYALATSTPRRRVPAAPARTSGGNPQPVRIGVLPLCLPLVHSRGDSAVIALTPPSRASARCSSPLSKERGRVRDSNVEPRGLPASPAHRNILRPTHSTNGPPPSTRIFTLTKLP
jgi:hypothetical protein